MPRPILASFLVVAVAGCTSYLPPPDADVVPFDGDAAFRWVVEQVQYHNGTERYRIPGSAGNAEVRGVIDARMTALGWNVTRQPFSGTILGRPFEMENVVAERPGGTDRLLILGAHFDSRPWADQDPDPALAKEPVLGANDAASGVAVLLELARSLGNASLNLTLRFVFFDGEDVGSPGFGHEWIQGSRHYARLLSTEEIDRATGYVNLDMVGDRNLSLLRESRSATGIHRPLQDAIWLVAKTRGHEAFQDEVAGVILDDHVPFADRGIRAVDVIHLDTDGAPFPEPWHTAHDDPAHMSPDSLFAVGDTVLHAILAIDEE
ncbi:MAG: M28 family peptidase [Methanobacteriota archaeon]